MNTLSLKKFAFTLCYSIQSSSIYRGMKTMQAWQILKYGGSEELHLNSSIPIPTLTQPLDVLIKVHAASINPIDLYMLEGYGSRLFNVMRNQSIFAKSREEFPLILGRDFSGIVVHVGKGVKNIKRGDEVWGATWPYQRGSHAEYVIASEFNLTKKPNSLSHIEAASLPYVGLTAWCALAVFGGLKENSCQGKRILVTGASGGIGTFAIQLLKSWGAEVVATCSEDAIEMIENLGADHVLDYQSPDFRSILKEFNGFDLIFDNVGGIYPELTINLLKSWQNSKYVTTISPLLKYIDKSGVIFGSLFSATQAACDTLMSLKDGRSFRWAYFIPHGYALKAITEMVDKKQITPIIEKVYKFDEIPEAFQKVKQGHARGKIVLDYNLNNSNNKKNE